MTTTENITQLDELIERKDAPTIVSLLESLTWSDRILAISRLTNDLQDQLFLLLSPTDAADLVEQFSDEHAADLIERLPPEQAADIVEELQSDQRADIIGAMDEQEAHAILNSMDPEEAADTRALTSYDESVAGGIMVTEFLSYTAERSVGDVILDMRNNAEQYADFNIQYLYVVNAGHELQGVLPIRDLLFATQEKPINEIMRPIEHKVSDTLPLRDLAQEFESCSYSGLPVVDRWGHMVGIVTRFAVENAQGEQAEKDYLSSQGIIGGEEIRTLPYFLRAKRRMSWLGVNIGLNMLSASVIAANQKILSEVVALAVFLPIISDMSGSAGNQAVAVTIRELAMGLVRPGELLRVLRKECSLGVFMGIILALTLSLVAWVWQGNPYLGAVAGAALAVNTVVGVAIGGCLPLLLKRFGFDPALASGLILTTVTDMCGFFLTLTFAKWSIKFLLPH